MTPHAAYAGPRIALHWIMLVLLAAVYGCIELREAFPRGSEPRELLKAWHFSLGLSVFVLVWMRLLARALWPTPPTVSERSRWQQRASAWVHAALYALMIFMPLAGWMLLSAEGKTVPFFGWGLPTLPGIAPEWADRIEQVHETVGVGGYWLIGVHASAALVHHYLLRDTTLQRMLPRLTQR
jgi:superoxide oxidase